MWKPVPTAEQCGNRSPDGKHRCLGPRGHHGYHGSRAYTWNGRRKWKLGNRKGR